VRPLLEVRWEDAESGLGFDGHLRDSCFG
jgi:hypothetical protein